MNKIIMSFVLAMSFGFPILAASAAHADPAIQMDAHTLIEIQSYDRVHHLYEIKDVVEYGTGPWYATPKEVARVIDAVKYRDIRNNPESILHNEYRTDRVMNLLPPPDETNNYGQTGYRGQAQPSGGSAR